MHIIYSMETTATNIRNFCIIAHIDHGKSTLADRLLEITGTIDTKRNKQKQILDTMDLEQERGITIKLQPVRMQWKGYQLNLIDTPGHVDFAYEVSRSLAACEGAILVVDASQGIEAQTIANVYHAMEQNLEIIPVLNKIDLPNANPDKVRKDVSSFLGIPEEEIISVSAKTGENVTQLLDNIIDIFPPPIVDKDKPTRGLVFDSIYDKFKGVVAYVKILEGSVKAGDTLHLYHAKKETMVTEVGYFHPKYTKCKTLSSGEVGYIVTGIKSINDLKVGDTICSIREITPWPGYQKVQPMVYASLYCTNNEDYKDLKDALEKLQINDSALTFEPESSTALGTGFRCGFLGLLHMEIVQERLEREYDLDLIVTAPSVSYIVTLKDDTEHVISNPVHYPDRNEIVEVKEPMVKAEVITPKEYLGNILTLIQNKRGIHSDLIYLEKERVIVEFTIPLASIITEFYDNLKSVSQGYASLNYTFSGHQVENLDKLDILVAGNKVDALSQIVYKPDAYSIGIKTLKKLKDIIPREQFQIALQAAIGMKILARENISAYRKDVTSKLYGGDVTRKNKLLKKQKAGKKRMKQVGNVTIPQEAFLSILKND